MIGAWRGAASPILTRCMLMLKMCVARPDTTTCLLHPYFWNPGKRLNFLQDASDRFEIMCRAPKDAHLLALEDGAAEVLGADWHARLDKLFIENLGKFRKYDGRSVQDLLRALRIRLVDHELRVSGAGAQPLLLVVLLVRRAELEVGKVEVLAVAGATPASSPSAARAAESETLAQREGTERAAYAATATSAATGSSRTPRVTGRSPNSTQR